jgi:hypothetical protein
MKSLPPTHVIKNFLSKEEIDKICLEVFENKNHWKKAEEYPTFIEKKSNFYNNKKFLENLLEQIIKFNINHLDPNSIKSCIDLIREYYKTNKSTNSNQFFTNYIGDDEFMYFIVSEAIKILNNHGTITDKTVEEIYYNFFITDKFQTMFGDAIYLIEGKRDFIDWEIQKIIRTKFSWVYEKLINEFENIFSEPVIIHPDLPAPGFHIFSLFDFCEKREIKFQYHKDTNILDYYPNIDTNTIYSFVFLVESPEIKPFVQFQKYNKLYYEYGNLYLWRGALTHKIGKTTLKSEEYRITFQGHLFFDENEKVIKLYF